MVGGYRIRLLPVADRAHATTRPGIGFPGREPRQKAQTAVGILAGRGPDSQDAFCALSEVGGHERVAAPPALRDALVVQAGRGPFGGVPSRLRWDHGLEFAAGAVEHAALALGVDPATPYAPHEKGKIERLHPTPLDRDVARQLPRGRMSHRAIQRALGELDAPASLWDNPPDSTIGEGANADGRLLMHTLTAWTLWEHRA